MERITLTLVLSDYILINKRPKKIKIKLSLYMLNQHPHLESRMSSFAKSTNHSHSYTMLTYVLVRIPINLIL